MSQINETETVTFEYNEDGLRTKKTATSTGVTEYTLHGKNIVHMTQGSHALHFYYDAQSKPSIVIFDGTPYAYLYNLQGDVIALVDGTGAKVVEYAYDAWGKVLSTTGSLATTLGIVQPFRYRGYVYDVETGIYYLRARYYNPVWNSFINADCIIQENLYTYCDNNPIIRSDKDGLFSYIVGCIADNTIAFEYYPDNNEMTFLHPNLRKGEPCFIFGKRNIDKTAYFEVARSDNPSKVFYVDAKNVDYTYSYTRDDEIFTTISAASGSYHEGSCDENVRKINFFVNRYMDTTYGYKEGIPYSYVDATNKYTERTTAYIKQFQIDEGLEPDGRVGPLTLKRIEKWIIMDNEKRG